MPELTSEPGISLDFQRLESQRHIFDALYHHPQHIDSAGGDIAVRYARSARPVSPVPILLAPGWSENSTVLEGSARALFNLNRSVLTFDHPSQRRDDANTPEGQHDDELRKALNTLDVLEHEDISEIDVIAHSEASIYMLIAAHKNPGVIRNLILSNPAGLMGKDNIPSLLKRFTAKNIFNITSTLGNAIKNRLRNRGASKDERSRQESLSAIHALGTGLIEGTKYASQNPLMAVGEISAIAQSDILRMLKEIRASGTKVYVMHGADDHGFPIGRMSKLLSRKGGSAIDGFLSVKGGHDDLYIHPEPYMRSVNGLLTTLEQNASASL